MAYHSKSAILTITVILIVAVIVGCTARTIVQIDFNSHNEVETKSGTCSSQNKEE